MERKMEEFCRLHGIAFDEDPQVLSNSREARLVADVSGKKWVAKPNPPGDSGAEALKGFQVLSPPFRCPRPHTEPDDPYLLYQFIAGSPLCDDNFESQDTIDRMLELTARVRALMRSLILVSHYEETLSEGEKGSPSRQEAPRRFNLAQNQAMDQRQKLARIKEIERCRDWTETKARMHCEWLQPKGLWPASSLESFHEQIFKTFSLHLPIVGNNLAHTAFHPEHLILCPDGEMAIVGWHVEPRPRFYMRYTYLAWSFFHSELRDPVDAYRDTILRHSSEAFSREHHLVFALCLLERLFACRQYEGSDPLEARPERLDQAAELFSYCVTKGAEAAAKAKR
ncbi:hypothetical protein ACFL0Q_05365 [Thermodesulfobacteriota bacterium]